MAGADLAGIGRRWQERIAASPEYSVVLHDNVFRLGLSRCSVRDSVFRAQQQSLSDLCHEYDGYFLEDCFDGYTGSNPEGEYYCIRSCSHAPVQPIDLQDIHDLFRNELTLVRGIGPVLSAHLKSRGCRTIGDLSHIRRYHPAASCVIETLSGRPVDLFRLFSARKGPSHPYTLLSSCLYPVQALRFVDIETLGLFGRPLILIGLGFFEADRFQVRQFLLRDIGEEVPVLTAFLEYISQDSVLVSFNGKSFDIPYIADRIAYYGLPAFPSVPHVDLLHLSRRLWKHDLVDCRLSSLEKRVLQINRSEDLPGALVPEWYCRYMETGNPGPLVPIVEHNRQDVVSLAYLYSHLVQEWYERFRVS